MTTPNSRQRLGRLLDVALLAWGASSAVALLANGINDVRQAPGWPRWLELTYLVGVLLAVPALLVAYWAKSRLKQLGAVLDDEQTAATHTRSMAAALVGVLCVQLPFFFHVEIASVAQAKFTVAAALVTYGAARLWLNRDA
ncbi:hypothetical protein QLQ12_36425 [Actinoplanes sp. NEAU-A12]|uniref:DUF2178 domain-containing protein n=1 Tax=Actinoplanes sandaracinus TaxID=3045177 RepID=A0ABT6WWG7_9ACTN|nr:hypothetical protein [Actinoplanes sandaracinus]MDI6104092.1 hypothetical protein [Actinoplanes sandaracinus]